MKSTRTFRTPSAPRPSAARRLRGAAGAGLAAAFALTALSAGTTYAEGGRPQPRPAAGHTSAQPTPAPGDGSTRPAPTAPPTAPATPRPSATHPGPDATEPPSATPTTPGEPKPTTPGKPKGGKELAHTGASTATMAYGGVATGLIAAGGGTVYAVRRRRA
ncbi:LPXTG cell wall anchor domain-containing protein [Streptomyces sp. bgisy084]|uniref:LPXTG cell wall anchor domain-containing protein n=1 Tax=Streptomyces sp. bgisy084 TaxID=3413777 RepID=UPI003D70CBD8